MPSWIPVLKLAARLFMIGVATRKVPFSQSPGVSSAFPCDTPPCGKNNPGRGAGGIILPKISLPNRARQSSPLRYGFRTEPISEGVLPTGRNSLCFRNKGGFRTISTWEQPHSLSPLSARCAGGYRLLYPPGSATHNLNTGHRSERSSLGKASRLPATQTLTGQTTSAGHRSSGDTA